MSNELTNYNNNGSDGWSDAADEASGRAIRGSIVQQHGSRFGSENARGYQRS